MEDGQRVSVSEAQVRWQKVGGVNMCKGDQNGMSAEKEDVWA